MEELYATGFNAWNQLRFEEGADSSDEPDDISSFTCVLRDDEGIDAVWPFFSYTLVNCRAAGLRSAGMVPQDHEAALRTCTTRYPNFSEIKFSEAANGLVVLHDGVESFHQYPSMQALVSDYPPESFAGFSDVVQVVAYDTGFAALSSTGQVYTWGDERFAICLGRDTDDDNPAHRPALVEDLQDLPTGRIVKIAAAGYILAALTAGNDLYCWGHPGRSSPTLNGLTDRPSPIDIDDNDIADVGVGESHLIALTSGGQVYVVGDNTNGQLGITATPGRSSWTQVPSINFGLGMNQSIARIAAGPRNSFLIVRKNLAK